MIKQIGKTRAKHAPSTRVILLANTPSPLARPATSNFQTSYQFQHHLVFKKTTKSTYTAYWGVFWDAGISVRGNPLFFDNNG